MLNTDRAPLVTRTRDQHDRMKCSQCGALVKQGFEQGHLNAHPETRAAGATPVTFTFVAGLTRDEARQQEDQR